MPNPCTKCGKPTEAPDGVCLSCDPAAIMHLFELLFILGEHAGFSRDDMIVMVERQLSGIQAIEDGIENALTKGTD